MRIKMKVQNSRHNNSNVINLNGVQLNGSISNQSQTRTERKIARRPALVTEITKTFGAKLKAVRNTLF